VASNEISLQIKRDETVMKVAALNFSSTFTFFGNWKKDSWLVTLVKCQHDNGKAL
jgi:hypothetical protein